MANDGISQARPNLMWLIEPTSVANPKLDREGTVVLLFPLFVFPTRLFELGYDAINCETPQAVWPRPDRSNRHTLL